jgi:hypothetical protein
MSYFAIASPKAHALLDDAEADVRITSKIC